MQEKTTERKTGIWFEYKEKSVKAIRIISHRKK